MAGDLTYYGAYEPDGEDEGYEIPEDATTHICEGCGEFLRSDVVVMLLEAGVAYMFNDADIEYQTLLDEDQEPFVPPVFMHLDCEDLCRKDVALLVEDLPPIEESHAVLLCDCCNSSIRMGEKMMTFKKGIITESPRDLQTWTFVQEPGECVGILCIACANAAIETASLDWPHLSQNGECPGCTRARCWRVGRCDCPCHVEHEVQQSEVVRRLRGE